MELNENVLFAMYPVDARRALVAVRVAVVVEATSWIAAVAVVVDANNVHDW